MGDEEKEDRHDVSAYGGFSASDKVWKFFTGFVMTAILGVGGFGYSSLQTKYENLHSQILTLQKKVIILESVSDDDGRELKKQEIQERDKKRKKELEEHNRARAEKLRRISQNDESLAGGDGSSGTVRN